jgi:hypothetical protein
MRTSSLITILAFLFVVCACQGDRYHASNELSEKEQVRLMRQMVYYSTRLPPNATDLDKFDSKYNWYYDRAAAECRIIKLFATPEQGVWYFLLARKARSITPMEEGIAGKVKLNADRSLADYEEVFRLWKMDSDTLNVRGAMLFDRLVRGKDLALFYPKFQGDKYIELPTENYYFDRLSKRWKALPPSP